MGSMTQFYDKLWIVTISIKRELINSLALSQSDNIDIAKIKSKESWIGAPYKMWGLILY